MILNCKKLWGTLGVLGHICPNCSKCSRVPKVSKKAQPASKKQVPKFKDSIRNLFGTPCIYCHYLLQHHIHPPPSALQLCLCLCIYIVFVFLLVLASAWTLSLSLYYLCIIFYSRVELSYSSSNTCCL